MSYSVIDGLVIIIIFFLYPRYHMIPRDFLLLLWQEVCRLSVPGPHTMSFPWKYRTVSAGREIVGCQTIIAEPDDDGNGEVAECKHLFYTV